LHDAVRLENLGIPAVAVATTEFMTPARVQAGSLGRPGFDAIYVPHPIPDPTPEQITARADRLAEEIVLTLTRSCSDRKGRKSRQEIKNQKSTIINSH